MANDWGNPLKTKSSKKKEETELPLFKKEKLSLSKSEAKKILNNSQDLGFHQIEWVQRWLEQRVREKCLPPQLSGEYAFASIGKFLNPHDAISLLDEIRSDYKKAHTQYEPKDDYPIDVLAAVEYHSCLPEPS